MKQNGSTPLQPHGGVVMGQLARQLLCWQGVINQLPRLGARVGYSEAALTSSLTILVVRGLENNGRVRTSNGQKPTELVL